MLNLEKNYKEALLITVCDFKFILKFIIPLLPIKLLILHKKFEFRLIL